MTLDEAIKREVQASLDFYDLADSYHTDENVYIAQETVNRDRAEYHEQLAEWLRELKAYRETIEEIRAEQKDVYMDGYNEGYEDAKELYS